MVVDRQNFIRSRYGSVLLLVSSNIQTADNTNSALLSLHGIISALKKSKLSLHVQFLDKFPEFLKQIFSVVISYNAVDSLKDEESYDLLYDIAQSIIVDTMIIVYNVLSCLFEDTISDKTNPSNVWDYFLTPYSSISIGSDYNNCMEILKSLYDTIWHDEWSNILDISISKNEYNIAKDLLPVALVIIQYGLTYDHILILFYSKYVLYALY